MNKPLTPAARAHLRNLRNPYATEQLDDRATEPLRAVQPPGKSILVAPSELERRNPELKVFQDPYAYLSEEQPTYTKPPRPLRAVAKTSCSRTFFRSECTRIFRPYSPAPERGTLANEHRAFIARNEDHSPEVRYSLLRELQRIDLSSTPGINPVLNREKDVFTEKKLSDLEFKVLNK